MSYSELKSAGDCFKNSWRNYKKKNLPSEEDFLNVTSPVMLFSLRCPFFFILFPFNFVGRDMVVDPTELNVSLNVTHKMCQMMIQCRIRKSVVIYLSSGQTWLIFFFEKKRNWFVEKKILLPLIVSGLGDDGSSSRPSNCSSSAIRLEINSLRFPCLLW